MLLLILLDGIDMMEQCAAYALMNPCPWWGTLGVEVVAFLWGNARLIDVGVYQAIGRICLGSHNAIEIVEKHAVAAHFRHASLGFQLLLNALGIFLNVLNVCQN